MGFEDEVKQSFGRPCRRTDGRFKQTYELTSSIVPRGKATIALFMPRRLAIYIAQALSQDHFVVRTNRIWAAS
jgi:hypothetical protein